MCEVEGEAMDKATQSNVRAIRVAHDNVLNFFDAAIKREHERQAKYRTHPRDDDPPPRRAA